MRITEQNWVLWQDIEPVVRRYVFRNWYDPDQAADVLSGGMEFFVRHHRGEHIQQRQIHFARLCVKHAAGAWVIGAAAMWQNGITCHLKPFPILRILVRREMMSG